MSIVLAGRTRAGLLASAAASTIGLMLATAALPNAASAQVGPPTTARSAGAPTPATSPGGGAPNAQVATPAADQTAPTANAAAESEAERVSQSPAGGATAGEVVVTGSRLPSTFTAPTPVTVVDSKEYQLSGTMNAETLLTQTPQFVGSQTNSETGNTVPGGTATLNLRGFGAQRNLVLVNGRRYTLAGPDQTVDINTIPTTLIKRTEVVTGGSSAVYGSDAITGVVNFVLQDDFQGLELHGETQFDSHTYIPTYNFDVTAGTNFAGGRGNFEASFDYLNREGITRGDRGGYASPTFQDGCVTAASFSTNSAGIPFTPPAGQSCVQAGGRPGLVNGGSGDIPNGRFFGIPLSGAAGTSPAYNAALAAAGLQGIGSSGFTFNNAGTAARAASLPADDYNLGPENYLIQPDERYMLNAFAHYDINSHATLYSEFHFSRNSVVAQLAPTNIDGTFVLNNNNPYLSPALQGVLGALDASEPTSTITSGTLKLTNAPNDGLAALNIGRRFVEVGDRIDDSIRDAYRGLIGMRGTIGDFRPNFLTDLTYDVYYSYTETDETEEQFGDVSRSAFQTGLLSQNGAAPLLNVFGQNLSSAAVASIARDATNTTTTNQQIIAGDLTGVIAKLPAGPMAFSAGAEFRHTYSQYTPDALLSSGDVAGFNASLPTEGAVNVGELYGEVRVPLLANLPFVDNLSANGAFRYSNYDLAGVGGVWTYSAGLDWRTTRDLTLRGQYQHAIRAPSVGELFGGTQLNFSAATDPCSAGATVQTAAVRAVCVATGVPAANVFTAAVQPTPLIGNVTGGSPNIGPETSNTFTFGAVWTPHQQILRGLALSVDYYNITLDGAIEPLGNGLQNVLNLCYDVLQDASSIYCKAVTRNGLTGQVDQPSYVNDTNANTGGIRTSGIDLEGRYTYPLPFGLPFLASHSNLDLSTDWNWTPQFTITPVQSLPGLKDYCAGAFGPTCGQPLPEFKGTNRVTWRIGPLSLSLRDRYIGETKVDTYVIPRRQGNAPPAFNSITNPVLSAQQYLDFSFTYDFPRNVQIYGGVNNLMDRDPPILGSVAPGDNTYAATYDVQGLTAFAGVTVKFH